MLARIKKLFSPAAQLITIQVKAGSTVTVLKAQPGQNLMDVTNQLVNSNANIYGLCDKQLACTTCSVHVKTHFDKLPEATDQEIDILFQLRDYRNGETRMACQIIVQPQLQNMIVEIPGRN